MRLVYMVGYYRDDILQIIGVFSSLRRARRVPMQHLGQFIRVYNGVTGEDEGNVV